ncbi:MAG: hypothetical protein M3Q12_02870, partial [Pseudomonadota bacterium]|nr:hypothetical protein [Pseudomonadota bacterium]
ARPAGAAPQGNSRPAPLYHADAAPVPAIPAQPALVTLPEVAPTAEKAAVKRYEPIQADEVAAFKLALAAASAHGVPAEASVPGRSVPRSYTLLTGFEDTEMPDSPALVPALSATQYGDLN